ncbi:hypothetical protein J4477_01610 [Candidatus Pacearchaeota archaeon]|nr:hypothetical protein [Candidatus Pacearchaeota archaeon]
MESFYISSREVIEAIRKKTISLLSEIQDSQIKEILIQRARYSSFVKGVLSYHIHDGLGGNFNVSEKIDFSSKLEIFCSSGAVLDNVTDGHEERNGRTTYLKEYGPTVQLFASQYALNYGLKSLFPFLSTFCRKFPDAYKLDQTIIGMLKMDTGKSTCLEDHIEMISSVNGLFNEVILAMAASTATEEEDKVKSAGNYGFNLGVGLGVYEELRDLLGEHGRRRATEVEKGRVITPMHLAKDFNYLPYIGRPLSEEEYKTLVHELEKRNALEMTRKLVKKYFEMAIKNLESVVDTTCIKKVIPLQQSIENSMDIMLSKSS